VAAHWDIWEDNLQPAGGGYYFCTPPFPAAAFPAPSNPEKSSIKIKELIQKRLLR
jgi:hypothetical protein